MVNCVAIIAVRNEAPHVRRALSAFINDGIDVVIIDNDSTDGTVELCREFEGRGLLRVVRIPWEGNFDLSTQLEAKKTIAEQMTHDWIVHADADEWLQSPVKGETLLQGISRLSEQGYNTINFEEFVFLPLAENKSLSQCYEKEIDHYYFFAPSKRRLMRAWKNQLNLNNLGSGGHLIAGPNINCAATSFILRHYVVLSYQHAVEKYVGRIFSDGDLKKNWHRNRLNLSPRQLELPESRLLKKLDSWDSIELDRSDPKSKHYWHWRLS